MTSHGFFSLPKCFLSHILSFLDFRSLCRLACTSRRFRDITSVPSVWRAISIKCNLPKRVWKADNIRSAVEAFFSFKLERQYLDKIFDDVGEPMRNHFHMIGQTRRLYLDLKSYEFSVTPSEKRYVTVFLASGMKSSFRVKCSRRRYKHMRSEPHFTFVYDNKGQTYFSNLQFPKRIRVALDCVEKILQEMLSENNRNRVMCDLRSLSGKKETAIQKLNKMPRAY